MKKIEMIRCRVRSPFKNENPEGTEKAVRYVPSEIFRLWHYLMESVKGFEISEVVTGAWLDAEMLSKERDQYASLKPDAVVEVFFTYFRDTTVGRPVIRYFPQERFEAIVKIFMRNFSHEYIQGGTRQTLGYFFALNDFVS
jgi:hypothetical protein